jgi:UDP-N-acetylmuramate dehydrogenase
MKLQHNLSLANYTSLRAGGMASVLIELDSNDRLERNLDNIDGPLWILGFGTNVLISDKGLAGTVVINNKSKAIAINESMVVADSGANWDELVLKTISSRLWGLEFTSGIPGGIGAAIAGNIAAYGHKVSDRLISAEVLNCENGNIETWENSHFNFGYRRSGLQLPENSKMVILSAKFKVSPVSLGELEYESALKAANDMGLEPDSLENRRKIIMEARRRAGSLLSNLSVGPWTAGSFFKNPLINNDQVETIISHDESGVSREQLLRQNIIHGGEQARVSAAHVLLAAGFRRGQTWGQVRLHPEHILKIENIGAASSQDIYNVVQEITHTVKDKLGITLEPEVRFLGEF